MSSYEQPRWLRDLQRFLPLKSQFVLSGNVRDLQANEMAPGMVAPRPLNDVLAGLYGLVLYDLVGGFRTIPGVGEENSADTLLRKLGQAPNNGQAAASLDLFSTTLERIVLRPGDPVT